jgi:hypothetical protein
MVQATYTWSHTIDNQSEPLLGDAFNLTFASIQSTAGSSGRSTFSQQFNPNADRGNSDFDQRQNLVLMSYWNIPPPAGHAPFVWLLRDWTAGGLAAFRSGFPYSIIGPIPLPAEGQGYVLNGRPNLISPNAVLSNPTPVPGGMQLLNASAFAEAAPGTLGTTGRNEFRGPGFYSLDLSLARSFPATWFGDAGRMTLRAMLFNVLNHANLNNPDTALASPTFGIAQFGRQGTQSGFPSVSPLNETPRQIQLSFKVEF